MQWPHHYIGLFILATVFFFIQELELHTYIGSSVYSLLFSRCRAYFKLFEHCQVTINLLAVMWHFPV